MINYKSFYNKVIKVILLLYHILLYPEIIFEMMGRSPEGRSHKGDIPSPNTWYLRVFHDTSVNSWVNIPFGVNYNSTFYSLLGPMT